MMVHAMKAARGLSGSLVDHDRRDVTMLLFALFALFLVVFGGLTGVGALISPRATVVMIWKVYFPLLIKGFSPVLTALLLVVVLTVMIDLLVGGISRMSLAAILGSLGGTALTRSWRRCLSGCSGWMGADCPISCPCCPKAG